MSVQVKTPHNMSLVSDSIYRSISQIDNSPAIQDGSVYNSGNAYAGVWFSDVGLEIGSESLPVEMDVNFGYNNQMLF
ncbi:MAG: hypothetical protein ACJAYV_000054 [Oleispira sp.]